jgi:hypothetical protein
VISVFVICLSGFGIIVCLHSFNMLNPVRFIFQNFVSMGSVFNFLMCVHFFYGLSESILLFGFHCELEYFNLSHYSFESKWSCRWAGHTIFVKSATCGVPHRH